MRIADEYYIKQIFSEYAIIPFGGALDMGAKIIKLNSTGYSIVSKMQDDIEYDDLLNALFCEYEVEEIEREEFQKSIDRFLDVLVKNKIITK